MALNRNRGIGPLPEAAEVESALQQPAKAFVWTKAAEWIHDAREARRLKTMEGLLTHRNFWEDLIGRLGGPITLRFILQPTIAVILAIRDGLKDAKAGRPLYFWSLFTHSTERRQLLKDGWKSAGFVIVFAIVIDGVYQLIVFRWFYPGEALTVAIVLAIVPYLQIRGLANSIARDSIKSKGRESNPVI